VIFVDNVKTVETIRALCKKKKTSLTRLEEKLGFSNGYIGKMAKRPSSPPYDKLVAIANELGVTVADLTGDTENEKKPTAQGDGLISGLPQDVQKLIFLCQESPQLASALLNLAQQLQNRSSGQA
jgi:transcriptional regulator with XRE-family HTH domain